MDMEKEILENIKINSFKLIGFSSENEYNYLLKQIYNTLLPKNPLIVDGGFKVPSNIRVINHIQTNLYTIDLDHLKKDDIILTNNVLLNKKIQEAILNILQPLLLKSFETKIIKNNFFVKHIVWIYERINEVNWESVEKPILIYYGITNEDDEIHLQILNHIGFQIIYINPRMNKENIFYKKLNLDKEFIFNNYANPNNFLVRIAKANEIQQIKENNDVVQTVAKKAKEEFNENMYKNGHIFKPWQFKKGFTHAIYIDAVIEDIKTYWNQDARFREGFEIKQEHNTDIIYVPNFFTKINGSMFDKNAYKDFVNFTKDTQLTVFSTNLSLLSSYSFSKEEMFSLMFVMEYDKVDFEKIKKHKIYKLNRINIDTQKFIIDKYNEFAEKFKNKVQQIDLLMLLASIISSDLMNNNLDYIKLIENFDFPFRVPKIVIYLKDRETCDINNSLFLHYLNLIGIDIIIFSPTGASSIEDNLFGNYLNIINLDEMNFDLSYDILNNYNKEKKGFFKKFFC